MSHHALINWGVFRCNKPHLKKQFIDFISLKTNHDFVGFIWQELNDPFELVSLCSAIHFIDNQNKDFTYESVGEEAWKELWTDNDD
jgi:hypothetical protein